MKKIFAVSAHPDDETLGAGGSLLKFKNERRKIFWLNFTNLKETYGYDPNVVKKRCSQIDFVREAYQFNGFYNLELKPAGLDEYPKKKLIERVKGVLERVMPDTIILPFRNDVHSDHRVAFDIVYSCTKVFRMPFIKKILMMEVLSETDFSPSNEGFVPNLFVDISDYLEKKIELMKKYKGEIARHPFPRSVKNIKALAVFRGATAGCKYAEGFMLLKSIE